MTSIKVIELGIHSSAARSIGLLDSFDELAGLRPARIARVHDQCRIELRRRAGITCEAA